MHRGGVGYGLVGKICYCVKIVIKHCCTFWPFVPSAAGCTAMSPHLSRCALTSWRVRHLHPKRKSVEDEVTGSYILNDSTHLSLSLSKQQHTWPWNDWRGLVAVVKPGESSSHWATGPSDGGHMFLCFTLLFIYFYFPQTNPGLKRLLTSWMASNRRRRSPR